MLSVKSRLTERETQVDSLQETIVNLAHENELLKRRIYGNKTEKLRTSENQLALGNLLNDEKQRYFSPRPVDVAAAYLSLRLRRNSAYASQTLSARFV